MTTKTSDPAQARRKSVCLCQNRTVRNTMTRYLFATLLAILIACNAAAAPKKQDSAARFAQFQKLLQSEDLAVVEKHLDKWQREQPDDPELAVARGNLYFERASQPPVIATVPKDYEVPAGKADEVFTLTPAGGTTETVGVMDFSDRYDRAMLRKATATLREAVTSHPQRMDIWMGVAHTQVVAEEWDDAFETLQGMIAQIEREPTKMKWSLGKPLKDKAETFAPAKLHSYALRGFEAETTDGLEFLKRVALFSAEKYPKHPYAYNDLAIYYDVTDDDKKVLEYLLKAHEVAPKDALVAMNIASAYAESGDKTKAREFYTKAIKVSGDEDLKQAAREAMAELGNE